MTINTSFLNAKGASYGDFVVTKYQPIEELNCVLRELEHRPSGALVMHIDCNDPENLFCLSFKTYPSRSDGAAHILEHTVLCGSKKFPVKDPFFAMTRRSLNTFMNALTGSDFTCYPAASQNEKDFYNLLDVYIDAVFHPQLKKMSFLQEGHRLEFTDSQNSKTPLQIKGVVFNEMKGSLSSFESRMWHALMASLVPDLPYAHNSGGDPKVIPDLSYEELLSFHSAYYHPSQCLFFFYGNFSLKRHLDVLAESALKQIQKRPPIPPIRRQTRFQHPVVKEAFYPLSSGEEDTHHAAAVFGFLTAPMVEQEEILALSVLDSILMDNDASLLKSALLASKLCVHVDAYMDMDMSEVPYAIVFKGCEKERVKELEKILKEALQQIVKTGIPQEAIQAALHQQEFSRLEIASDHAPFGLTLFMRSALAKQHGCAPEQSLIVHSLFDTLLKRVQDPRYLPDLIKKYFLDNPHQVHLTMHPDPKLCEKEAEEERKTLENTRSKLSEEESVQIVEQARELLVFQKHNEEQSLDCLPKVTLQDVAHQTRSFSLEHEKLGPLSLYHHDCFTNHITYADFLFDLPQVAVEDLGYLHLLISLIPELGCGKRGYADNLRYIQSHIGGIGFACGLYNQVAHPNTIKPALHIKGKALDRHLPHLFSLIQDMVTAPHLQEKARIEELLKKLREAQLNQLNRKAMRYATYLALSGFSPSSYVNECWQGLSYFQWIESLTKQLATNSTPIIEKLMALKEQLFTFHNPVLVLGCSKKIKEQIIKENGFGLFSLPSTKPFAPYSLDYPVPPVPSQGRPIPSQVAFTVEAFRTSTYLHPHAAPLTVATALLENLILHRLIREQGGAYGCGANYNTTLGYFYFHAYRDPHLTSTARTFHQAIDAIASGQFTPQDLEEAKLGIIQQLDTPISPNSKALIAYNWIREGRTEQMRQEFRDRLLHTTTQEIQEALSKELVSQKEKGVLVSFAGKELLDKEGKELTLGGKPLPVIPLSQGLAT